MRSMRSIRFKGSERRWYEKYTGRYERRGRENRRKTETRNQKLEIGKSREKRIPRCARDDKGGGNKLQALGFCQVVGDYGGAGFDEFLFGFGEGVGEIAFDVELTSELFVCEEGDDHFGLHHGGAGEIARIGGDILDNDDLASAGGGAAEAGGEGNASVGGKAAGEWADDEVTGVDGIDEIKTNPIVAGHFFVKARDHALHEGLGGGSGRGKGL